MMPPSMNRTFGPDSLKSWSMVRADFGDTAFRSKKYSGLDRCFAAESDEALTIRWAVATASRGGTIDKM